MKGNYNRIAPFYDYLSRIIYGDAIVNAHKFLIEAIVTNSTILIVGGGTGWILEEIAKKHPEGLDITYVDISEKMIAMAKKRNAGNNKVTFVNQSIQDAVFDQRFTIVMTPFLLDNFSATTATTVFNKLHHLLLPQGKWLFADFYINEKDWLWKRWLLKAMYFFFQTFCNIEADRLPDTNALFSKHGYTKVASKAFFKSFICSAVYQKQNNKG